MRVKNTSVKIITIGKLTLLPDEIAEIPEEFVGNPVLDCYEEMDFISIIRDEEKQDEEEKADIPENLNAMKKGELKALCEKLGIEVSDEETKAELIQKLNDKR